MQALILLLIGIQCAWVLVFSKMVFPPNVDGSVVEEDGACGINYIMKVEVYSSQLVGILGNEMPKEFLVVVRVKTMPKQPIVILLEKAVGVDNWFN